MNNCSLIIAIIERFQKWGLIKLLTSQWELITVAWKNTNKGGKPNYFFSVIWLRDKELKRVKHPFGEN